jgi:hypothetical protein
MVQRMTQHTPHPSHSRGAYSKVFSAGFGGAFLALTGAVGYDLSGRQAPTDGGRWADGPVWVQLALGIWLLLMAIYWTRRIRRSARPFVSSTPTMKQVGHGTTSGTRRTRSDATPDNQPER